MKAMRITNILAFSAILGLLSSGIVAFADGGEPASKPTDPSRLLVVWTSGDRDVALKMVFMYTSNAKKNNWWGEIRLLIWGPSSKLLAGDEELQRQIRQMKEAGVEILACKACADSYGVSDKLRQLGADVKYMGVPLTEMLKSGWTTLTF